MSRGFSLVESLVAITVLIVGVLGPLNIAARGIGDGLFARNQIVANYLAQEAIEIIVNKRYALAREYIYTPLPDGEGLFEQDDELWNCIPHDNLTPVCAARYQPGQLPSELTLVNFTNDQACTDSPGCYLIFNTASGLYLPPANLNQLGPNERGPVFRRDIQTTLISVSGGDVLKVFVTVEWKNKDVDKSLTVVEYLYSQG